MTAFQTRLLFALVLIIHAPCFTRAAEPIVKPGARLAILGDSITEQKQYSKFIELYLTCCQPDLKVEVMQFGWSGERAKGMDRRLENDVLPFKPTIATTCYGMNDGGYRAYDEQIGQAYEKPTRDFVGRLKTTGCTVIVGSPGVVDVSTYRGGGDPAATYNENLAQLRDIARTIAKDEGFPFANVFDAMMSAMTKAKGSLGEAYDVAGRDGVHPQANGHLVMAYAFLRAMGFDGDLGTITVDTKGKATASGGHQVLSAENGKIVLESSRYPFCFFGNDTAPVGTRSILPHVPFNQELNRLTLVVKNLNGENARVTWGQESHTFTKAQLEAGINLAAEFTNTPFDGAFNKVAAAIAAKQGYETYMIKQQISSYPTFEGRFKDDAEVANAINVLRKRLWERQQQLIDQTRATMQPVQHTITIEAI